MIEYLDPNDILVCPHCGEAAAYKVRRGGFVSIECDLCDYYDLIERPKGTSHRDVRQMQLQGVI